MRNIAVFCTLESRQIRIDLHVLQFRCQFDTERNDYNRMHTWHLRQYFPVNYMIDLLHCID